VNRSRTWLVVVSLAFFSMSVVGASASAQSPTAFRQANLTSDIGGGGRNQFSSLVNPWGMAYEPGHLFWVSENGIGLAGEYDGTGLLVNVAGLFPGMANPSHPLPTGVVYNPVAQDFVFRQTPAQFIFVTADGTVQTWANENGDIPTMTTLALDFSAAGSIYTGVAILNPSCCREYLAVADFRHNLIHTFDTQFNLLGALGDFTDPHLPQGFSAFNVQQIGTQVFVTYAELDSASGHVVTGAGQGFVSIFDQVGNFVQRFASNGPLNAPWGIVQASGNFGPFSNAILVGNFGDGAINAFDPTTGNFLGTIKDTNGTAIENPGLWSLVFRTDGVGNPNALYFTAGIGNQQHGLLGVITVDPATGPPDFNFSAAPRNATIPMGQSANFTLTALPTGGFSGTVQFSCSAPAGVRCSVNPPMASTSGGVGSSTLTVTASSPAAMAAGGTLWGAGVLLALAVGLALGTRGTSIRLAGQRRIVWRAVGSCLLLAAGTMISLAGCGSYGKGQTPSPNPMSVVVTAQSGTVTHTATVTVTVQ